MKISLSTLLLLMVAFIWGTAFVAQTTGMKSMGPVTFTGFRLLLGGLVLLPFTYFYFNNKSLNFSDLQLMLRFYFFVPKQ